MALGAISQMTAAPAIRAELVSIERDDAWRNKVARLEAKGLGRTACRRDELPAIDAVELTDFLPFLRLTL